MAYAEILGNDQLLKRKKKYGGVVMQFSFFLLYNRVAYYYSPDVNICTF